MMGGCLRVCVVGHVQILEMHYDMTYCFTRALQHYVLGDYI